MSADLRAYRQRAARQTTASQPVAAHQRVFSRVVYYDDKSCEPSVVSKRRSALQGPCASCSPWLRHDRLITHWMFSAPFNSFAKFCDAIIRISCCCRSTTRVSLSREGLRYIRSHKWYVKLSPPYLRPVCQPQKMMSSVTRASAFAFRLFVCLPLNRRNEKSRGLTVGVQQDLVLWAFLKWVRIYGV